jgi:hypothetical protein
MLMMAGQENDSRKRRRRSAAELVRRRLLETPGALVRAADIKGAPLSAVSRALARLAAQGAIQRVRKGVYYAPKETLLGPSRPLEPALVSKILGPRARPTGVTAANLLGLTTQVAGSAEYAAYAVAPPQGIGSAGLRLRPRGRTAPLEPTEAALLEVLRDRGRFVEVEPCEATVRIQRLLSKELPGRAMPARSAALRRLRDAALEEPPRVRAMLGTLMQDAGLPATLWEPLRASLNPHSRFDFGLFRELRNAKEWQAK